MSNKINFDARKYVKNKSYREIVNAVLLELSHNLGIPFHELYNGLFFTRGNKPNGILVLKKQL